MKLSEEKKERILSWFTNVLTVLFLILLLLVVVRISAFIIKGGYGLYKNHSQIKAMQEQIEPIREEGRQKIAEIIIQHELLGEIDPKSKLYEEISAKMESNGQDPKTKEEVLNDQMPKESKILKTVVDCLLLGALLALSGILFKAMFP